MKFAQVVPPSLQISLLSTLFSLSQGTIYRNAQLRYTNIMYCTLWEECKQSLCLHRSWRKRTKALIWYDITVHQKTSWYIQLERIHTIFGFLVNLENTIAIFFEFFVLIPPTAVHRFDAWDKAVPGLYISCTFHCRKLLCEYKVIVHNRETNQISGAL